MKVCMSSKKRNNGSLAKIQGHYYNNNDDSCFQEIKEIAPIPVKVLRGISCLLRLPFWILGVRKPVTEHGLLLKLIIKL